MMSLSSESSVLLANGGKSSSLSMLVRTFSNPVDSWVVSDSVMRRINEDDFVVSVRSVLTNPVTVKNSEVSCKSSNSDFSNSLEGSSVLHLVDTLRRRLSVNDTLGVLSLSSSCSYLDSVDDKSLLSLVAESSGLVRSRRSGYSYDGGHVSVFPCSESKDESHCFRLLLLP